MDAKELRIGNLVYFTDFPVKNRIERITKGSFRGDYISFFCWPIPLTEEWLVEFGSKRWLSHFIYHRFKLIWKEGYNYWYVVDKEALTYLTKIEFVHEWQNFVSVMNGEELTLK